MEEPAHSHREGPDNREAGALRPIYCLADSQLLFWHREDGTSWLASVVESDRSVRGRGANGAPLRAAYVGASNGDEPAFYSIFAGAMEGIGVTEHRMIRSSFDAEDRAWLGSSDLVLLAGGDPVRGWRIFEQSGMREVITGRYFEGATLLGISAGAVQLGWAAGPADAEPTLTFRLVPAILSAHDEENDWRELRRLLSASGLSVRGLGIPTGGGLIHHPDGVIEPVRHPVHELVREGDTVRHSLLFPGQKAADVPVSPSGAH
jgi:hypothetical protein